MDMYRTGNHLRFGTSLGDLPPECQVWRVGFDEDTGCKEPSPLHHQPQAILAIDYS